MGLESWIRQYCAFVLRSLFSEPITEFRVEWPAIIMVMYYDVFQTFYLVTEIEKALYVISRPPFLCFFPLAASNIGI
jgi:hypothetical protein